MSRQSPWDCPFCGRMSAEEPGLKRQPHSHLVDKVGGTNRDPILAVWCWHCGAHGPLASSVRVALERWRHRADQQGAPRW